MNVDFLQKEGKQDIIVEYVVACEVGKEVVWLRNMLSRFVWEASKSYCDKLCSIKMFEDPKGLCLLMCKVVTDWGCDCWSKSLKVLEACSMLSICLIGRDLKSWDNMYAWEDI